MGGELADQCRVFADFHVARTIHSVHVGNTILATDHDLVRGRVPRHGGELAVHLVDVLQELSGAGVDQLGGPVASNRDEPFGIDAECGPKHPILVRADLVQFLPGGGFKCAHGVVRASDRDLGRIRREGRAKHRIAGGFRGPQQLALARLPELDLAESGGSPAAGHHQVTVR